MTAPGVVNLTPHPIRLRVLGARLLATTNPDGPAHWLRKNYILRNCPVPVEYVEYRHVNGLPEPQRTADGSYTTWFACLTLVAFNSVLSAVF